MLPTGKLLTWSSYQPFFFEGDVGTAASQTYTSVYDPVGGGITPGVEDGMTADMFCSGIAYLADGRVMVNGGSSSMHTAVYDSATSTWASEAMMNIARGYNSTVTLSTGEAFTIGGSWAGDGSPKDGEVWSAAAGWRQTSISENNIYAADPIDVAQGFVSEGDNHPWLFAAPNGRVFHAGPSPLMNWIDTAGDGSITAAGNRGDDAYSINGVAVMYQPGKIFKTGGQPSYSDANATANSYVIDIAASIADPAAPVSVRAVTPMTYARGYANGVVLPGGKVLIVGGQTHGTSFNDDTSVMTPELWDPATERFSLLAPMDTPRNYHSVALLLPDATGVLRRRRALRRGVCREPPGRCGLLAAIPVRSRWRDAGTSSRSRVGSWHRRTRLGAFRQHSRTGESRSSLSGSLPPPTPSTPTSAACR